MLSLFTVSILHLLAHLVSYIIMILVSIASIGGTAFLWYTYIDIKYNLDHSKKPLLIESIRNETAFFWYSITATIITVNYVKFTSQSKSQLYICIGNYSHPRGCNAQKSRLLGRSLQRDFEMFSAHSRPFPATSLHVRRTTRLFHFLDFRRTLSGDGILPRQNTDNNFTPRRR